MKSRPSSALWLLFTLLPNTAMFAFMLALIVGFGVLRALASYWGLPNESHYFSYHPDEIFLLLPSFGFAEGSWNPHFFNYGTLYIYLVGIASLLSHATQEAARTGVNLCPLYLVGRFVTVWMSFGTIALLFFCLGRYGQRFRYLAALLLAICPLHFVNSAYATVDVPATFFLTLAFLLALRGAERPNHRWGVLVGLAVGLGAATKYNAGLFVLPAILAPLLPPRKSWRWSWCLAIIGGAVLGFAIGCPFFWTREFRQDLLFELHHARLGGTFAFVGTGSGWVYHLIHGLPVGLGFPLLASVLIGVIAALRVPSRAARLSVLWVFFYLAVIGFGKEWFIRYLVPLTPFLAVLGAFGWQSLYRQSRRPTLRALTILLAAITVVLTSIYASHQFHALERDPRDLAGDRLAAMHERTPSLQVGLVSPPWYFDPPVSPFNGGPLTARAFAEWNQRHGKRVVVTGWEQARLAAEKPDVFFLSDLESQDLLRLKRPDALAFVAALGSHYRSRSEFSRSPTTRTWLPLWAPVDGTPAVSLPLWLAPPRSWAPPDWLYQSPVSTMYYDPR